MQVDARRRHNSPSPARGRGFRPCDYRKGKSTKPFVAAKPSTDATSRLAIRVANPSFFIFMPSIVLRLMQISNLINQNNQLDTLLSGLLLVADIDRR